MKRDLKDIGMEVVDLMRLREMTVFWERTSCSLVALYRHFEGKYRPHIQALYIRVLISLWLFQFPIFLFAAKPKEFFLDGLKKLEQRSLKYVELREDYVNTVACFFPL
jgi:hypothetical protein